MLHMKVKTIIILVIGDLIAQRPLGDRKNAYAA